MCCKNPAPAYGKYKKHQLDDSITGLFCNSNSSTLENNYSLKCCKYILNCKVTTNLLQCNYIIIVFFLLLL